MHKVARCCSQLFVVFVGGCYALYGFVVSKKHNPQNVDRNLVDLDMMSGAFASSVTPSFESEPVCRLFDIRSLVDRSPELSHYSVMAVVVAVEEQSSSVAATISDGVDECVVCDQPALSV